MTHLVEEWKDVKDDRFEKDRYSVSNTGKLFDKKRSKISNVQDNGFGYKKVVLKLKDSDNFLQVYLHRLIASVFFNHHCVFSYIF